MLILALEPLIGGMLEGMFWFFEYRFNAAALWVTAPVFLALGALLMDALEGVLGMALTMSMGVVQLAVGFSMAVGVVFGLYPAGKASKLRPIEALHYD